MDNKNNMDECMWMIMGSIHESDRITVAKCLDMQQVVDAYHCLSARRSSSRKHLAI